MKLFKILAGITLMLSLTACPGGGSGGSADGNSPFGASGIISLNGTDANSIGDSLVVAEVRAVAQSASLPDYVVIGSEGTTDEEIDPNNIPDPNNMFLIVVNQNFPTGSINSAISMTIRANGVDYSYICYNPGASYIDCGNGINVNIAEKKVSFVNVDVENTDSSEILRLNGEVSW